MEPLDWRDQRIETVLRQTGKTIDELCRLRPDDLVRLCGERIVAYRLIERSSTADKPAMSVDIALSEIAEFVLPDDGGNKRDSFVRAMTRHINDWLEFERAYRLRTEAGGTRPPELPAGVAGNTRIWHAMCHNGLSLKQIARMSDSELLALPDFGRKTLKRLREVTRG